MRRPLHLAIVLSWFLVAAAPGCTAETDPLDRETAALGSCGIGGEVLAMETLTVASIPGLSALERAQIVLAVQESAHTDVTTVEEAFDRVDPEEINQIVLHDHASNQYYVEIEYGAGENSYGAIFYWGTAHKAAAIHDGFQEECGPPTINPDPGDTAAECAGFLTYVNTATFAALDAYLPSNVAQAIVDTRNVTPFASVASVVAVSGVAETRLQQLLAAARTASLVGPSCDGIHDQLAVSVDHAAAIVALVNAASADELRGVLAFLINQTVVSTLVATRPYATAAAIAATSGVGPAVFRALRNEATFRGPFEVLVDAVNDVSHPDGQANLYTHFDWVPLVTSPDEGLSGMTCFGIAPELLPPGATIRPTLANGAEVQDEVAAAVALADFNGGLAIDPAPGLHDLAGRTDGREFFGCYITSHPNPWQYDSQTFFVDTETGFSVLSTFHYVE